MTSNEPHPKQAAIGAADVDLPIIEEQLQLDKREVVRGRVRVRTITDSSEELLRQELQGERLEIVRVPLDVLVEPGAAPPQLRTEGNVTILPVVEEVLVVERRLLIKEELRLIRHATKEVIETPVTLRKQRAVVERLDSEGELITDAMEKQT